MANTNKVEFGMSGVVIAALTEQAGTYTIGSPTAIPGAVSLTTDATENETNFYADNRVYYALKHSSSMTGELIMAKFTDDFKKTYLGYKVLADGGLAEVSNAIPKPFVLGFIGEGDAHNVKRLLYNVIPGKIKRSFKTNAEGVEFETETLPITIIGIPVTDDDGASWSIIKANYTTGDSGYATALTTIAVPALPATP